jgi:hypothetical protein
MSISAAMIRKLEELEPKTREAFLFFLEEIEERTNIIAVGRSEFNDLKEVVRDLAEAQKRTELRVEELAQAQMRTEVSVKALADDQRDIKKQLGGLAMAVGYGIEDRLIPHLKAFALREFGIEITLVDRRNIMYADGTHDEVNLFAEGAKGARPFFVIGECKAQPGKKDFDRFHKMVERLRSALFGEIQPFLVGFHFTPEVEVYADKRFPHIRRYKTFQITEV